jgi:hypothetical protein
LHRLILESADINNKINGEREAVVVLRSEEQQFVGRGLRTQDNDDLAVVAIATLSAIREYMSMPVEFDLKTAAMMQPDPLIKYLFVVKVEVIHETKNFTLTGACLGEEHEIAVSVAKAALDATNQVVDYLVDENKSSGKHQIPSES